MDVLFWIFEIFYFFQCHVGSKKPFCIRARRFLNAAQNLPSYLYGTYILISIFLTVFHFNCQTHISFEFVLCFRCTTINVAH
jgi:hypothetical protein